MNGRFSSRFFNEISEFCFASKVKLKCLLRSVEFIVYCRKFEFVYPKMV